MSLHPIRLALLAIVLLAVVMSLAAASAAPTWAAAATAAVHPGVQTLTAGGPVHLERSWTQAAPPSAC